MNNARRKDLFEAKRKLDDARAALEEARAIIETARSEEEDYKDNMPESFQNGEKGSRAEAAVDALQEAMDDIESIDLDEIDGKIDTAME